MKYLKIIFRKIFLRLLCEHEYKLYKVIRMHWHPEDGGGLKWTKEIHLCPKCGKIKKIIV